MAAILAGKDQPDWSERIREARERGQLEREQLKNRLIGEGAVDLAQKLETCGTPLRLVCVNCGERKVVEIACKRRWCPACAYLVMRERLNRFSMAIDMMRWPLFLTFTMLNSPDPESLRTMRDHWSRMRRRKLLVERITGGISTLEVTNGGKGWHPHLHIIANCRWLSLHTPEPTWRDTPAVREQKILHASQEVERMWCHITGQQKAIFKISRITDVKLVRYILKYAVKGSELIACRDDVAPLIRVLSRSRMVSAFGDLHGKCLSEPDEEKPVALCPCCGDEKPWMLQTVEDGLYRQSYDRTHGIK